MTDVHTRAQADAAEAGAEAGRTPPHDILAEQSVLGGMLLSKDAVAEGAAIVREADFYRPAHQMIYRAAVALMEACEPVDAITVNAELTRRGEIARAGGAPYLHTLTETIPTAANTGYYARIVAEAAVRRKMIEVATHAAQLGYSGQGETAEILDRFQSEAMAIGERSAKGHRTAGDALPGTIDWIQQRAASDSSLIGVPTGFADLDRMTRGLQEGQMVVIGARPSIGKSTLGMDLARAAAIKHSEPTAMFNLEMGERELMLRLISAEAKVPLHDLQDGKLGDAAWQSVAKASSRIQDAPLFIEDAPSMTVADIRAACRQLKREKGLRLVVVDYLQIMRDSGDHASRQDAVSDMSRSLKLMAKELDVTVVALSQLNRKSEEREDKRPQLAYMRESGAVEQDADVVILLHREDFYDKNSMRAGEADLIVAKNRNGGTADVVVAFQGHYSRFVDMAPEPPAAGV